MDAAGSLLSAEAALARVLDGVDAITDAETVSLARSNGRTLYDDVVANCDQPPFIASAMDGYALRFEDLANGRERFEIVGTSSAGHPFEEEVPPGGCVRVFTGAVVPTSTDCVVIQENVEAQEGTAELRETQVVEPGSFVRPAGLDFKTGERIARKGQIVTPARASLLAAARQPEVRVRRRPVVHVIANGDELRMPGEPVPYGCICASNGFGVTMICEDAGAEVVDRGVVPDDPELLLKEIEAADAEGADVVVTLGGASVGDHDLVFGALKRAGVEMDFAKVAMKPGKPLMFGRRAHRRYLGLPGNPVSSLVGALIFLVPLIDALQGRSSEQRIQNGRLGTAVPANGDRQLYARGTTVVREGETIVTPVDDQDSSLLRLMADADCLIVRPPHEPAKVAGDPCRFIEL